MSKKIKHIMSVSAILAIFGIIAAGEMPQPVYAAGYQNAQNSGNPAQNAEFGPYMKRMQDKIKANWKPPVKEMDTQIVVKYRILKDGTLDSYGILSSSGAQDLDNAAIDALRSASPFEPLPASFNKDSILVQFTFDYQKPNSAVRTTSSQPVNRQIASTPQNIHVNNTNTRPPVSQPVNRQIPSSGYTPTNQIAEFQPLVPLNDRTSGTQVSIAGTPLAPIRIKAGPGEPIQVEKLPPQQKMFPPVLAVQSYEQTPATLTGSQQTIQKYVQAPGVAAPTQVTQVYVPPSPPPEILEPIQPPKAIVPLPPKNTDPRTVAVPPPIRQTPAVDITTYAQGDILDIGNNKNAQNGNIQGTLPPYVVVQGGNGQTPVTAGEINRVVPPQSYPEVEYVRFEDVDEEPVNTTLATGINKVEMPTRRRKLTQPVAEEQYPDVPERRAVPAPTPRGPGVYIAPVTVADFSEYMRKVERKITRKWHPPLSDYSTKVVVNYVIHKSGELGNYYVAESSGNSRMDASAMEALKKAAPFPPLPQGCGQSSVDVKFTFDYNVYKNKSEKRGIKELEEGENL